MLLAPVAEELKFVVAPIDMFVETFPPPVLISKLLIEPVTVNPDPDITNDPVITADPENGNAAPPALGAHEALNACVAYEAVPSKEPVNDVAVKAPVIFTVFAVKSPFISGVPEPDAIYNLLLSSVAVEGPAASPIAILFEELPENKHPACWPNAMLLDPIVL